MPRASGDTPTFSRSGPDQKRDAPRKWGYTGHRHYKGTYLYGCPAQVGIHRNCHATQRQRVGMPRASGDTPHTGTQASSGTTDAPRKWGYTRVSCRVEGEPYGCPAQVGIHLFHHPFFPLFLGMPRASGDTPFDLIRPIWTHEDAPRKWGYTCISLFVVQRTRGCPAQVGIHRFLCQGSCSLLGMPRASGDTPVFGSGIRFFTRDAPRKWGYTEPFEGDLKGIIGCPAQVGIHLSDMRSVMITGGMPRASGDTPCVYL